MFKDEITIADIEKSARAHGRKGTQDLMGIIHKKQPVVNALKDENGQVLCKYTLKKMNVLLDKLVDGSITEEERHMYNAYRGILFEWAYELERYTIARDKIKGA